MVFSSIPVYVDPPNWQHQQPTHHHHHHQANGSELLPPLPPQVGGGGSSGGSIRPGSMADRARLAKIPPPEAALKCPRCDSTNTKFCYFNNYSLSQPRHFCKTCRRYWTRGGALRNVPVGGGCRRNKKNKRSRSKSPANTSHDKQQTLSTNSSTAAAATTHELIGQLPQPTNLPFMASLQNLNRYSVGNMGLGLREIQGQTTDHMGFQIANSNSVSGVDQWRLQQFPFLNGFESGSGGSFPFQSEGEGLVGDIGTSNNRVTQLPSVKMEENGALNLTRAPLGGTVSEHNQFYSWSDMSGLASNSSTTHLL